jgi:5,10-methenyltetrahydrofolate synthetase
MLDQIKPRKVHYFEPLRRLAEPDVIPVMQQIASHNPELILHTIRALYGHWQTVDSAGEVTRPLTDYDVIIVPMLGFNQDLHRLGYGGGYYDRLLSQQLNAQKIGICFELGYVPDLPVETHDVALDCIITEASLHAR